MRIFITDVERAALNYAVQYALKENEGRGKYPAPLVGKRVYERLLLKLGKKVPKAQP